VDTLNYSVDEVATQLGIARSVRTSLYAAVSSRRFALAGAGSSSQAVSRPVASGTPREADRQAANDA
jgi:hypothetical protein